MSTITETKYENLEVTVAGSLAWVSLNKPPQNTLTIPFMEGLNGVILVESVHYFPFILINLSAALNNIDRAMEESAQNLGAHGTRLFRRIVFPLAMPGYVAGATRVTGACHGAAGVGCAACR